jgi:hypothetical protein
MIPRAILAVAYATGRSSHARQVKGDDPDKKGYPGPPGWGLDVRLTTPHSKKVLLRDLKRKPRAVEPMMMMVMIQRSVLYPHILTVSSKISVVFFICWYIGPSCTHCCVNL